MSWINRVAKWRGFFAGWQLGTRPKGEPESDAVRDHREITILLRCEVNALAKLLLEKRIMTEKEFSAAIEGEAKYLDEAYQRSFPGFSTTDAGLEMKLPEAAETQRRMNFKP